MTLSHPHWKGSVCEAVEERRFGLARTFSKCDYGEIISSLLKNSFSTYMCFKAMKGCTLSYFKHHVLIGKQL